MKLFAYPKKCKNGFLRLYYFQSRVWRISKRPQPQDWGISLTIETQHTPLKALLDLSRRYYRVTDVRLYHRELELRPNGRVGRN